MWVLYILYAISSVCVRYPQNSTVDSYREIIGCNNFTCVKHCILFNFTVVSLSDCGCIVVKLARPTSPSMSA